MEPAPRFVRTLILNIYANQASQSTERSRGLENGAPIVVNTVQNTEEISLSTNGKIKIYDSRQFTQLIEEIFDLTPCRDDPTVLNPRSHSPVNPVQLLFNSNLISRLMSIRSQDSSYYLSSQSRIQIRSEDLVLTTSSNLELTETSADSDSIDPQDSNSDHYVIDHSNSESHENDESHEANDLRDDEVSPVRNEDELDAPIPTVSSNSELQVSLSPSNSPPPTYDPGSVSDQIRYASSQATSDVPPYDNDSPPNYYLSTEIRSYPQGSLQTLTCIEFTEGRIVECSDVDQYCLNPMHVSLYKILSYLKQLQHVDKTRLITSLEHFRFPISTEIASLMQNISQRVPPSRHVTNVLTPRQVVMMSYALGYLRQHIEYLDQEDPNFRNITHCENDWCLLKDFLPSYRSMYRMSDFERQSLVSYLSILD